MRAAGDGGAAPLVTTAQRGDGHRRRRQRRQRLAHRVAPVLVRAPSPQTEASRAHHHRRRQRRPASRPPPRARRLDRAVPDGGNDKDHSDHTRRRRLPATHTPARHGPLAAHNGLPSTRWGCVGGATSTGAHCQEPNRRGRGTRRRRAPVPLATADGTALGGGSTHPLTFRPLLLGCHASACVEWVVADRLVAEGALSSARRSGREVRGGGTQSKPHTCAGKPRHRRQ